MMVRDFVHQDIAKGPFKLVSEDFGLSNILVRSEDEEERMSDIHDKGMSSLIEWS